MRNVNEQNNRLDLQSHPVSNVQNSVYFVWVCVVHYKQDVKVSITYMAQYVRTWKYKLRYLQRHFNRHVMDSFNFVWVALINRKEDMEIPITNMSHHWTYSNQKDIKQHHERRINCKILFFYTSTLNHIGMGLWDEIKDFFVVFPKKK